MKVRVVAQFDGGSRKNPGIGGSGSWMIIRTDNKVVSLFISTSYPSTITNNEAEVLGLIQLMDEITQMNFSLDELEFNVAGDSNILVQNMLGKNQIKNQVLNYYMEKVHLFLSKVHSWNAKHVFRKDNKTADFLANVAMDEGTGKNWSMEEMLANLKADLKDQFTLLQHVENMEKVDFLTTTRRKTTGIYEDKICLVKIWSSETGKFTEEEKISSTQVELEEKVGIG